MLHGFIHSLATLGKCCWMLRVPSFGGTSKRTLNDSTFVFSVSHLLCKLWESLFSVLFGLFVPNGQGMLGVCLGTAFSFPSCESPLGKTGQPLRSISFSDSDLTMDPIAS
jgi:hypothetical protein